MTPKKILTIVLIPPGILFLFSCSNQEKEPEQAPLASPSNEWVLRHAKVSTLERMAHEYPEQVFNETKEFEMNQLLEAGILTKEGELYEVEKNINHWNTSEDPSRDTHINNIDFTLTLILESNEVTWCGDSISGKDFVLDYTNIHEDSFSSYEEYEKSIADYVDCGTGEL